MVDPLDEGARLFTVRAKAAGLRDHLVLGIPYFGSWQDGTTASGNIALEGGHIDINLVGYTDAERKLLEAIYREVGFYADIRLVKIWSAKLGKWFTFKWQTHLHMVLKDCPHRSSLAKAQVYQWQVNAADGLAATPDLDDGPRTYVKQTWAQYVAKHGTLPSTPAVPAPAPKTVVVQKGQTLGKIAAALGVTLAALVLANPQIKNPDLVTPGQTITVPAKGGATATPKPSSTPKPTATTKPKPATPAKPAPKPVVLTKWSAKYLHAGARNRTVVSYEKALAAYLGSAKAKSVGLTGSVVTDGYYGTATSAATKAAYGKLGMTPNATEPGPSLLRVLAGGAKATSNPAPKPTTAAARVDASKLHKGITSRHVTAYQRALRAYVGAATAKRVNPAGVTGYYGAQTQALTKAAYRKLGATPNATEPGPGLLAALGLR